MPTPHDDAPLIVTAQLDASAFAILNELRRRHFPPSLNRVPAHISLFHSLPGVACDTILADVRKVCGACTGFALQPAGVRFLGRGVAFAYESRELACLHTTLSRSWTPWLTAQNRQPFKAHVTIQNKVDPKSARSLFECWQMRRHRRAASKA